MKFIVANTYRDANREAIDRDLPIGEWKYLPPRDINAAQMLIMGRRLAPDDLVVLCDTDPAVYELISSRLRQTREAVL